MKNIFSTEEKSENPKKPYFPMMIDISNKRVLIVGGGKIAARRASTLLKCGAEVTCVSPKFCEEFPDEAVKIHRKFESEDLNGIFLVTTATNNREVNHKVGIEARKKGIPVSVADCKSECDFYFPSLITSNTNPDIAVSVCSAGNSIGLTKKLSDKLREVWDSWIKEIINA